MHSIEINVEVQENEIYTGEETKQILKISQSTFTRLIKKGVLRAAKVGGQYRILGKEILALVSPDIRDKVTDVYARMRDEIKSWENTRL